MSEAVGSRAEEEADKDNADVEFDEAEARSYEVLVSYASSSHASCLCIVLRTLGVVSKHHQGSSIISNYSSTKTHLCDPFYTCAGIHVMHPDGHEVRLVAVMSWILT